MEGRSSTPFHRSCELDIAPACPRQGCIYPQTEVTSQHVYTRLSASSPDTRSRSRRHSSRGKLPMDGSSSPLYLLPLFKVYSQLSADRRGCES